MAEVKVLDIVRRLIPRLFAAYLVWAFAATAAFALAVAAYARPLAALYLMLGAVAGLSARRLVKVVSQHHVFMRASTALAPAIHR